MGPLPSVRLHRKTDRLTLGDHGQFLPILAMVMMTSLVFMVAMVNVYRVSRAKLKMQNLAEAVALNLASQEAQAYNAIANENEWLNHMVAGSETPTAPDPQHANPDPCANAGTTDLTPGISCAEVPAFMPGGNVTNNGTLKEMVSQYHVFPSSIDAQSYASLVKTVNDAQMLFVQAYNTFLGATANGVPGANPSASSMDALLKKDIPDLRNDPSIHLWVWNTSSGESKALQAVNNMQTSNPSSNASASANGNPIQIGEMVPLNFKVRDLPVAYYGATGHLIHAHRNWVEKETLGQSMTRPGDTPQHIGYIFPDDGSVLHPDGNDYPLFAHQSQGMPTLNIGTQSSNLHTGIGVAVRQDVALMGFPTVTVKVKAKAYIVKGSGKMGQIVHMGKYDVPHFEPTYWVKLAN